MDSKKLCAFNLTRESFLCMGLTAVDSATDPLAVLKVLVEGLELDSESGFWITSLTGIPGVPRISPFDLVYLTEGKTVVRGIEVLPGVMLPALEKQIVSVLVLPLHTVSSTQTRAGDRLLLCAEEEMMRHLAQISHKSGDTAIAQNGGVLESPPRRTVIPPPIVQVPAQRAVSADESRRESVARAEREIRAKVDSLRAAPVPLAKATESEAERSRTLKATPPAIPKIEPNQTPNGAGGSRKVPPRNQTPQIPVPAAGSSGTHNIEFTVKYHDGGKDSPITINPYAKLFWAVDSKSSTVVLGKAGGTFDVELGAVPTIKAGPAKISMPTWITVGPKTYWGNTSDGISDSNFGVVSTGLKAETPLTFLKGGAGASVYAQVQYYHLINDNLTVARTLLTNSTGRDKVVFGAGLSFGF